jgi:hypothetical protein
MANHGRILSRGFRTVCVVFKRSLDPQSNQIVVFLFLSSYLFHITALAGLACGLIFTLFVFPPSRMPKRIFWDELQKSHCPNHGHCNRMYGTCMCEPGCYGRFCHLSKSQALIALCEAWWLRKEWRIYQTKGESKKPSSCNNCI